MPDILKIPYVLLSPVHALGQPGRIHEASVIPVGLSQDCLTKNQITVLTHLSKAVAGITPIYAQQRHPESISFMRAMCNLAGEHPELKDYATLFAIMQAPYDKDRFGVGYPGTLPDIATDHAIVQFLPFLQSGYSVLPGGGLYPPDITPVELQG
ncbi:hypothetical protein COY95_03145, partial [Candidatus Woesearchaeota archaeon CG_4_10_14_0_8_um_filter_47_5]